VPRLGRGGGRWRRLCGLGARLRPGVARLSCRRRPQCWSAQGSGGGATDSHGGGCGHQRRPRYGDRYRAAV